MGLTELPMLFVLIGLTLYTVLAGADFGACLWQLTAGTGPRAQHLRERAHHAIAPVWEANHVWLIFVLTVLWTAYPLVFGSIASTLSIPLFIAAVGIVFRGTTYALHYATYTARERAVIDTVFSLSSILTPFALGAAVGGIASGRVPVGNAAGNLLTSWLNPTSILVGTLAVTLGAYLAAVYLAADAVRDGDSELEQAFRRRALGAGVVAGLIALSGLFVLRVDATALYNGLLGGSGFVGLLVSVIAGTSTLVMVWRHHFEPARYTAALGVAAIVAGWALAQYPELLPGLNLDEAAAPTSTMIAVVVAVLAGALTLFPSLALLFRLVLRGRFEAERPVEARPRRHRTAGRSTARSVESVLAPVFLLLGVWLLTLAEAGWAHAVGVLCLFAFIVLAFGALSPGSVGTEEGEEHGVRR
jgi:cytochrome d ubiquinol oxidase subunit II